jgi:hypothetical protein
MQQTHLQSALGDSAAFTHVRHHALLQNILLNASATH